MNEIDQIRLEHIKKFPESILEVGDWEVRAVCKRCKSTIHPNNTILTTRKYSALYEARQYLHCPHCPEERKMTITGRTYTLEPLPHYLIRRRFITTEYGTETYITGMLWWRKQYTKRVGKSGVWEEELLDPS
jgi:type II secretory ATPase GspE/PulE/Tfp pilus assembly ATPase PilB-like protein